MTTPAQVKEATVNSHKTRYVLQDGADSTVAGGTVNINYDGQYIFAVSGTLDTAQPTLYAQRSGTSGFAPVTSNNGSTSVLTTDGEGCTVQLSRGDKAYSQTTVVGGSSDYTTVLNLTTV